MTNGLDHTEKRLYLRSFPEYLFIFGLLLFTGLYAASPDANITISGIITDGSNPVENAVVSLVSDTSFTDSTDANGAFLLTNVTAVNKAARYSKKNTVLSLHGNKLRFSIPNNTGTGNIRLYTLSGDCIFSYSPGKEFSRSAAITLPKLATGLYVVTLSTDHGSTSGKLVAAGSHMYLCRTGTIKATSADHQQFSKKLAAVDQLRITKDGFIPQRAVIESYEVANLSIAIKEDDAAGETSLCKRYRNYFPVGAAVDGNSYRDSHAAIWKEHFNSMVCENEMKWDALEAQAGNFQFGQANNMVNAAVANNMMVRGHTLCWFDQTPSWVFQGTKEQVLQRLRNHITGVMNEFKDRIHVWDVVNEAVVPYDAGGQDIGEDLTNLDHWGYRDSKWFQAAGEDHIFEAFRAARAADPTARLFYNDYWNYLDGKRAFIISFVKRLQEEGLIDGIGLQCHMNITAAQEKMHNQSAYQTVGNLEKEIREYSALGLDVHITELDISIYTRDYPSTDQSKWFTGTDLNAEYQDRLAARYKEFFDMFRRNADKIQNVTLWGISDDNTWLSEFDSGRPDHPLLFDNHLQPKKAFDAIMNF